MKSIITLHATPNAWLTNSVLAPHLDAFIAHLQRGRYVAKTTRGYLASIAHFAYWMTQSDLPVAILDERTVEQFLIGHLPRCDCPTPVMRTHRDLRAALGHLLRVLLQQSVIAEPSAHSDYIAEQLQLVGTTSYATALAAALRAYFRYRITCGDSAHGLLGVIASPAHWGLASLPRALKLGEVKRLLDSFTSSLPFPKRGLAIVRCLLDMGLRCCEVAQLQLADIDGCAGTVTLRHTKSCRQDILSLPAVTGEALAGWFATNAQRPRTLPSLFGAWQPMINPQVSTPSGA